MNDINSRTARIIAYENLLPEYAELLQQKTSGEVTDVVINRLEEVRKSLAVIDNFGIPRTKPIQWNIAATVRPLFTTMRGRQYRVLTGENVVDSCRAINPTQAVETIVEFYVANSAQVEIYKVW